MPLGIRWKRCSLPPVTTVWPALFPPCERMTMSTVSASRSMTLPLPSSPHWPPTRIVTLIRARSVLDRAGSSGLFSSGPTAQPEQRLPWLGREDGNPIRGQHRVPGDKGHPATLCLGDEHPVEGIVVVTRERACAERIGQRDVERADALANQFRLQVIWRAESPDRCLDGDLPRSRRADENVVQRIFENSAEGPPDPLGRPQQVQKHVGVQQVVHPSPRNALSIDSGSGASKSSESHTRPRHPPKRRGTPVGLNGMSLAIGRPARPSTTSSPA